MKTTNNTSWFSIVLAMWLVVILSLTGLYVIEYMVPFSKNIKWIENASQAFYESYAWVEDTLLRVYSWSIGTDYSDPLTGNQDYGYSFVSRGLEIPTPGLWNSPYDDPNVDNFSTVSQIAPVSLAVGDNVFGGGTNSLTLTLRVPDFDRSGWLDSLESGWYSDVSLWQLSSENNSLTSKNLINISAATKTVSLNLFATGNMWLELWDAVSDTGTRFSDFYTSECWSWNACTLKISVIKPLVSPSGGVYPFLEYRLVSSDLLPYPNTLIQSRWKSYGFTKSLDVYVPQQTTSSAFDFTVLQ